MDQSSYLSQTLWDYRERGLYTDLTLVCEDGSLPTHAAMLAGLFTSFRISFLSREEVPECLFLPGLATASVKDALRELYFTCNNSLFVKIVKVNFKSENNIKKEPEDTNCSKDDGDVDKHSNNIENFDFGDKYDSDSENEQKPKSLSDRKPQQKTVREENYALEKKDQNEQESGTQKRGRPKIATSSYTKILEFFNKNECKLCGEMCGEKHNLVSHMKSVHGYKTKVEKIRYSKETKNCQYCDKTVSTDQKYKKHLAAIHREEVLLRHSEILTQPCEECDKMFQGVDDLDKHSKKVHKRPTKQFNCSICQTKFDSKSKLLKHRSESHQDELQSTGMVTGVQKKCPYCEKTLKSEYLNTHIFNVHKDKRSLHPEISVHCSCDECGEEFFSESSRKLHIKSRHSQAMQCKTCDKIYPSQHALEMHIRTHSNTTHICKICSMELKNAPCLTHHLKKHRYGDHRKDYKYRCFKCKGNEGRYQTEEFLQKHILKFHSGVQYMCSQCPLSFNTPNLRNLHENVHKEKTIKCDECEKMFSGLYKLNSHIKNVHNFVMDKICPHCGEAFRSTNFESFKSHVNRHTNTRPYACDTCGKDFLGENHLKSHMKRHSRDISCDKCGDLFGGRKELYTHKRKVHEGVQLICRFGCDYQTWGSGNRNRHELSCQLNPMPNAPYTVAIGTANNYIVESYHAKLKESTVKKQ